ncbi:Cell division protein FtsP precursor [Gordonia bronchialis]|nr:Cell division protein FtsP precursor [Gordonia bronchialis]
MLNGSSGRSYHHLGFSDDREFRLIGTDGGLLPKPVVTERIFLSPGERAEIVVDLRPDEQVLLRSYPADAAHRGRIDSRLARRFGLKDTVDVLTLRTGRVLGTSAEVPARLAEIAPIAPASSVPRRNFDLQWHMINHERMAMSRIDFAPSPRAPPRYGASATWTTGRTTSTCTTSSSRCSPSTTGRHHPSCGAARTPCISLPVIAPPSQ